MVTWYLSTDTLFWQVSTNYNRYQISETCAVNRRIGMMSWSMAGMLCDVVVVVVGCPRPWSMPPWIMPPWIMPPCSPSTRAAWVYIISIHTCGSVPIVMVLRLVAPSATGAPLKPTQTKHVTPAINSNRKHEKVVVVTRVLSLFWRGTAKKYTRTYNECAQPL